MLLLASRFCKAITSILFLHPDSVIVVFNTFFTQKRWLNRGNHINIIFAILLSVLAPFVSIITVSQSLFQLASGLKK
ncbi:hypothetical protein AWQ24_10375 [Picosynechococcus sp. PCC 8807]|nr:hypothetical protein AWQ24_10375 [Picosynechococcus sp. PCC 8807]